MTEGIMLERFFKIINAKGGFDDVEVKTISGRDLKIIDVSLSLRSFNGWEEKGKNILGICVDVSCK